MTEPVLASRRPRAARLLLALAACAGCGSGPSAGGPATPAATPLSTCTLALPSLGDTHLTTDGPVLRDALGRQVILRGLNAGGRSKLPPYLPFDFTAGDAAGSPDFAAKLGAYLDRAASWGVDAFRVPCTWAAVEPAEGAYDEAFLARLDALVDGAWKRRIYVYLDFHQDIYSQAFCGDGLPDWTLSPAPKPHACPNASWFFAYFQDAGVRAAFDRFWDPASGLREGYGKLLDLMAKRYGDRAGVVGFDLFNEPSPGSAKDDGQWEATTLTGFYSELAARLHAAAPRALAFFEPIPDGLSNKPRNLGRPTGGGLVYAPHFYELTAIAVSAVPAPDGHDVLSNLQLLAAQGATFGVPVVLGEFGVATVDTGPGPYLTAHYDAFDALQLGSTQWEYSTARTLWNDEQLSVVAPDGAEHAEIVAAFVRAYPRAIAGSGATFAYDAAANALSLSYAPPAAGGGLTEVMAPVRLFPAGLQVTGEGACADVSSVPGVLLLRDDGSGKRVDVRVTSR